MSHFAVGLALMVVGGTLAAGTGAPIALAAGGFLLVLAGLVFDGVDA